MSKEKQTLTAKDGATAIVPTSFAPAVPSGFTPLTDASPSSLAPYLSFPMGQSKSWPDLVQRFEKLEAYTPILFRPPLAPIRLSNPYYWQVYGFKAYAEFNSAGDCVGCWEQQPDGKAPVSLTLSAVIIDRGDGFSPVACIWEARKAMETASIQMTDAVLESSMDQWPKLSEEHAAAWKAFQAVPWGRVQGQLSVVVKKTRDGKYSYPQSSVSVKPTPMAAALRLQAYLKDEQTVSEFKLIETAFLARVKLLESKMTP
jgi:hypothetical protein